MLVHQQKESIVKFAVFAVFCLCAAFAHAQSAYTVGNRTYYQNANGSSAGSSYTSGGRTYYQNANGSSAGSTYTSGGRTYYTP